MFKIFLTYNKKHRKMLIFKKIRNELEKKYFWLTESFDQTHMSGSNIVDGRILEDSPAEKKIEFYSVISKTSDLDYNVRGLPL